MIVIKCDRCSLVDINKLAAFQAGLKKLAEKDKVKLEANIIKYGITFPIYVWKSAGRKDAFLKVIDGNHRVAIYKKLGVTEVPVIYVDAKGVVEAKKYVMLAGSRYAEITQDGFNRFVKSLKLDEFFPHINIPGPKLMLPNVDNVLPTDYHLRLKYTKVDWERLMGYLVPIREMEGPKAKDETIIMKALRKAVQYYANAS